jgi:general secretion pathway protein D
VSKQRFVQCVVLVLALVLLSGCAAKKAYSRAEKQMRRENYDQAVLDYSKALALDPGNSSYTAALERAKLKASAQHFERGKRYQLSQQWELAIAEFQQTLILNPSNQHAAAELEKAAVQLRRTQVGPSELELLKESARRRQLGPPQLDPRSNIPILLNFQDIEVGKIFEAISKASGINFIYDEKVDLERPRTIDIGNVTLEKALDILMLQTKNFYKVIDEHTLLVAPDTRQKRQEYEDQVIRTFFLSNADTKTVVTLLRSLLQSRQIAENADLNSVTIKDTPEKVAIAERIINANDKSKGEVLIDVELLEINRSVMQNVGIDLDSKILTLTFGDGNEAVPLNNLDILRETGNWTIGVIPRVVIEFLKTDSETKLIAKPQLRVEEGERAEILIGDRVPIPTTSFNTSQTVGGNIVPITSFTYQNVGITVQLEPRVHHNKEVTLQVQVEVSQVTDVVEAFGGQSQPVIGTRQIQTVIRLRDGETNLLAGLIQRADSDSLAGVPGLIDIPGVRRLFSSSNIEKRETDIIMTLTPRIIRIPNITEDDLVTLWVGTEENMRLRGVARNAMNQSPFGGQPAAVPAAAGAPPPLPDSTSSGGVARAGSTAQPGTDTGPPPAPPEPAAQPPAEPDPSATQAEPPTPEPAAVTPAVVRVVPSSPAYRVGDTVVLNIIIDNAQNIGSTPFHLRYNKDVLQFVEPGTEGPFMSSGGAQTVFLAGDLGGGGEVVVGLSRMGGGEGVSGSGTLATFQFLATNPGPCNFAFTGASVKDPQARNLPAAFETAVVEVQP